MADLNSDEIALAQRIAYEKSLVRGNGGVPAYDPEAAVGDFWQAAGEVISRRIFTVDLLQAINEWQRGGDAKLKSKRGKKLKEVASGLPERFRQTDVACYRRMKLQKGAVMTLGTDEELAETISAWTENENVAKGFKGGVPEPGVPGAIFAINPGTGTVILNLSRLYNDGEFQKALSEKKSKITDFEEGIGKYGNTQEEVVIENGSVQLESIHTWGGHSSSEEELATEYYGRKPTSQEMDSFRKEMQGSGNSAGPKWLREPDAVKRISEKLVTHAARLAKLRKP